MMVNWAIEGGSILFEQETKNEYIYTDLNCSVFPNKISPERQEYLYH